MGAVARARLSGQTAALRTRLYSIFRRVRVTFGARVARVVGISLYAVSVQHLELSNAMTLAIFWRVRRTAGLVQVVIIPVVIRGSLV